MSDVNERSDYCNINNSPSLKSHLNITNAHNSTGHRMVCLHYMLAQQNYPYGLQDEVDFTTYKFNFDGFGNYLEGIAGGSRNRDTAKAIVRDVELFFKSTSSAFTSSDIEKLFNKLNLETFFQKLLHERNYKPTTIAEKIRRMKLAIKFVIHKEDSMLTNKELYFKGNRLLDMLTQWCLSLTKAISLQRQQHSLKVTEHLPLLLDPQEFLENDKV